MTESSHELLLTLFCYVWLNEPYICQRRKASCCVSYRVRVELDGRRVFAAADAAVPFHFAAEELPPLVELSGCPVALCLCGTEDHIQFVRHRHQVPAGVCSFRLKTLRERSAFLPTGSIGLFKLWPFKVHHNMSSYGRFDTCPWTVSYLQRR